MDFFSAQDRAHRSSQWLVLWFSLCVAGVVVVLCAVTGYLHSWVDAEGRFWAPDWFAPVGATAAAVIGAGSVYKLARLSGGGAVVARDLGGRQIDPGTSDLLERRLLNVVEEMSIASGLPMPEVWLMDEELGINAFAAGTDPANAVIGVTRGCLERLDRDELQGVVAHEFSHILNGDMKLNMRLAGWIFGLVMVAMLGRMLLEAMRFVRIRRSKEGAGIVLAILVAGLTIWIVGGIGSMFARFLQAAISRQREFLADASAVQFTRNPTGIAGALKKIGGFEEHGKIQAAGAAEAGHFFFASGLDSLFATHPPLDQRIRAIEPSWSGKMLASRRQGAAQIFESNERLNVSGLVGKQAPPQRAQPPPLPPRDELGPQQVNLDAARHFREQVDRLELRAMNPGDAVAMVIGLLAASQTSGAGPVIGIAADQYDLVMADRASQWMERISAVPRDEWQAVLDSTLPWLRRLSRDDAQRLLTVTDEMVHSDGEVDFFEFLLQKVLYRHVSIAQQLRELPRIRFRSISELKNEVAVLVDVFTNAAGDGSAGDVARREFFEHTGTALPTAGEADLAALADALEKFDASTPLVKSRLLRMCSMIVAHDQRASYEELILLRCVADAIGAPIPPMPRQLISA
ncbi:MAG: M48 family metallopeptidase [Luteolibacter sp.]